MKEAKQLMGHKELVRTMTLIRRSASLPLQVWSVDVSGTVVVWDALKLRREEDIIIQKDSPIFSICQVLNSAWLGGETDIVTINFEVRSPNALNGLIADLKRCRVCRERNGKLMIVPSTISFITPEWSGQPEVIARLSSVRVASRQLVYVGILFRA